MKRLGGFGRYSVPLWLARQLRRSRLCDFEIPTWLTMDRLEGILEAELQQRDDFQPLPFHYVEIATIILEW
jgi:GINS complex subunit 2